MASRQRRTSQATDSKAARARSATVWVGPNPTMAAVASSRHHGARAPSNQGAATTPRPPGGLVAASAARDSAECPVTVPSQARRVPAAESPPRTATPHPHSGPG